MTNDQGVRLWLLCGGAQFEEFGIEVYSYRVKWFQSDFGWAGKLRVPPVSAHGYMPSTCAYENPLHRITNYNMLD